MGLDRSLDGLTVASPCTVPWESMEGDERTRFCGQCRLHVFDFSELTRGEIEALVSRAGERICGRIHRRPDGTLLTKDCVTWRDRLARRARRVRAVLAGALGVAGLAGCDQLGTNQTTGVIAPPRNWTPPPPKTPPNPAPTNPAGGPAQPG